MSLDGGISYINTNTLDGIDLVASSDDITSIISVNNNFIEANYLRLDTSNDPLTGVLQMNGNLSVSGVSWFHTDVYSSGQVTANSLQSNTTIGGQSIYCDTAEFGIDSTSMGILVYNQMSIGNTITCGHNISIAGNYIGQNISVSNRLTVDNISVSGNIICRGKISVSGNVFTQSDVSVSGSIFTQNNVSVAGSITSGSVTTSSSQVNGNQTVTGVSTVNTLMYLPKDTYFSPNLPPRDMDVYTGSKRYQLQSLLGIDETWAYGGITRISVNTFLQTIPVGISVSGTSTMTAISVSSAFFNGNVGIGATPECRLYVRDNAPGINAMSFECESATTGKSISMLFNIGNGSYNPCVVAGDTLLLANKGEGLNTGALTLTTHSQTASGIRIGADGNVTITSFPTVVKGSVGDGILRVTHNSGTGSFGYSELGSGGNGNTPGFLGLHKPGGTYMGWMGWNDGSDYGQLQAEGYAGWRTNKNFKIDGKVAIGTNNIDAERTVVINGASPLRLQNTVNNQYIDIRFQNTTNNDTYWCGYGTVNAGAPYTNRFYIVDDLGYGSYQNKAYSGWWNFSDKRLKRDIVSVSNEDCLNAVNKINIYTFKMNMPRMTMDVSQEEDKTQMGVIAQECETAIPFAIDKPENDGYYGVCEGKLCYYLIGAVNELTKQVKQLSAEIERLKKNASQTLPDSETNSE